MRIVVVSPLPPQRDGIGDYAARLVLSYERRGHTVAVVPVHPTNVSCQPLGRLRMMPMPWWRTVRAVRAWRPDIVHVQHTIATYGQRLPALWAFVAACRLAGLTVVVTHHEVTRDLERLGPVGRLYYRLTALVTTRAHVHTTSSAEALDAVTRLGRANIVVHPHPVYDLPREVIGPASLRTRHGLDGRLVLLLFGYVHVEKGILETVSALGALLQRRPELRDTVRLVIAGDVRPRPAGFQRFEEGDREYLALVHAQVSIDGLDGVVTFTGHVPDGEVAGWFDLADILLLPYLATEQSGVANLAIAAGTPVLATRVGGLAELLPDNLPALESLRPGPFSAVLEAALADPAGLRDRSAAAYVDLRREGGPEALVDAVTSSVPRRTPDARI